MVHIAELTPEKLPAAVDAVGTGPVPRGIRRIRALWERSENWMTAS